MSKPNCFKCKWKKDLPGNADIGCSHPLLPVEITDDNPLVMLMSILSSARKIPFSLSGNNPIGVIGDPHGIKKGWFNFPFSFDPTWLIQCKGFDNK